MDAAIELFGLRRLPKTPISNLCRTAGVTREALLEAVYMEIAETVVALVRTERAHRTARRPSAFALRTTHTSVISRGTERLARIYAVELIP